LVIAYHCGESVLREAILLGAIALAVACPASAQAKTSEAKTWEAKTWRISCATVRAYVAEVGMVQARAVASAHGMTAWQERLARRCLSEGS
jgi:high-affinity Fe2+/Pb2+ permease